MPITSSSIVSTSLQENGTTLVLERHTFHTGETRNVTYYAQPGTNISAIMAARAQVLEAQMREEDLHRCVFIEPWDYVLKHANNSDLAPYVREIYRVSEKFTTVLVGMRMLEWVNNGRFTTTQMRNAFGLTVQQWNTLRDKILLWINHFNSIESAAGE